ncbi:MAG: DUF4180 domain-containing protein [Bacillota bacterium]|jgi:hypothetical protein
MKIRTMEKSGKKIASIDAERILIAEGQSALALMMSVKYETGCDYLIINKSAVDESFFRLSNGIAGEILQKFINYHMKVAIVGDYSKYESKALRDFIYESNNGHDIFFVSSEKEAVEKLTRA